MNKLIVLEGIDGSGKTTICNHLVQELNNRGIPAIGTTGVFEPYESVRKQIWKNNSVAASYYFYLSANYFASHKFETLLKENWIICDRFVSTTYAYHAAKGFNGAIHPNALDVLEPNHTFHITTIDENTRQQRVRLRADGKGDDSAVAAKGTILGDVLEIYRSLKLTEINNDGDINIAVSAILQLVTN